MASFTDSPELLTRFNPYVQQLPVEAMMTVGVEKQRRYDEGIRRIQSSIDKVAGLDIYKDSDKNYLKSKLSELDSNLKMVAAGDFSNYQLVNSIGRNIGKISADENIRTAVSSTAFARSEMGKMDKDREEGKLDPSNEYNFTRKFNEWMDDENVGTPFNKKYIPHFDIWKFARETFDAVKPDGMTFDQIYQLGADGNPVQDKDGNLVLSPTMTKIKKEGRMPERVKQTIDQIFSDPRVGQQLEISGQYNYKDTDSYSLKQMISSQKDIVLASYDDAINLLNIDKNLGKDVDNEIERIKGIRLQTSDAYDKYIELADSNPDSVRGNLYKDDVRARYSSMFGQINTETTVHDNPGWRAMFDMQKEANAIARHNATLRQSWRIHEDNMLMDRLKIENDLAIAELKEGKGIVRDQSKFTRSNQPADPKLVVAGQAAAYEKAATEFAESVDFLIWETMLKDSRSTDYQKLIDEGMTDAGAKATLIEREAKKSNLPVEEYRARWMNEITTKKDATLKAGGDKYSSEYLNDAYDRALNAKKDFESEQAVQKNIAEELRKRMNNPEAILDASDLKPQIINVNGTDYELGSQQLYDLSLVLNDNINNSKIGRRIKNNSEYKVIHEEALKAFSRLTSAGLDGLVRTMISDFNEVSNDYTKMYKGDFSKSRSLVRAGYGNNWSSVYNVANKLDESFESDDMEQKAEIIQGIYGVKPNLTTEVLTGDAETDAVIVQRLSNWASNYQDVGNVSHDFKNFVIDTSTPKNNQLGLNVVVDSSGNPQIEIVLSENSKRKAGMTITYDEAMQLSINPSTIYEPREISSLRNVIKVNGGQTSKGNPADPATYIGNFDYYYSNIHLPNLSGQSKYRAKVNIREVNGIYYPFIFMGDGIRQPRVVQFKGSNSLGTLVNTIKSEISPAFIERTLNEFETNGR